MTIESAQPSEELKQRVLETLKEGEPLSHEEIVERTSSNEAEVQRALNDLWREGKVSHTVDRRFEMDQPTGD